MAFLRAYVQAAEYNLADGSKSTRAPDVTSSQNSPENYENGTSSAPSDSQQVHETEGRVANVEVNGKTTFPHDEAFIIALRREVDRWTLTSHLWWAGWAVVQARVSLIDFDFFDYARLRLDGYKLHKKAFFNEGSAL